MTKSKIKVKDIFISIENDYVSLNDIIKQQENSDSKFIIMSWLKNNNTLDFLEEWEILHNPNFKAEEMDKFRKKNGKNLYVPTSQKFIKETNAIGIISKSGRYGGTYAHKDIALNFCYWINPRFQVYLLKAFQQLIEQEYERQNLKWHISKITDNVDELRNLLDTIPSQNPKRNRLNNTK